MSGVVIHEDLGKIFKESDETLKINFLEIPKLGELTGLKYLPPSYFDPHLGISRNLGQNLIQPWLVFVNLDRAAKRE